MSEFITKDGLVIPERLVTRDPSTGDLRLTPDGREIVSSIPIEPPLGYIKQPSLADQMRVMLRQELLARELAAQGFDTMEEADDFDVDDDFDPTSPWEERFDPQLDLEQHRAEQAETAPIEASDPPADGPSPSTRKGKKAAEPLPTASQTPPASDPE